MIAKTSALNLELSEFCCFHNNLLSSSLRATASVAVPPSKPRRCFLPLSLSENDLRERLRRRAAEDETTDDLYASGDTGFGSLGATGGGNGVNDTTESWSLRRNVKSTRSIRSAPSSDLLRKISTSVGFGKLVRANSARGYDGSRLAITAVRASNRQIRQRKLMEGHDEELSIQSSVVDVHSPVLSQASYGDANRRSGTVTPISEVRLRLSSDEVKAPFSLIHGDQLQNRRQMFLMARENILFNSCNAATENCEEDVGYCNERKPFPPKHNSYIDTIKRYNRALERATERSPSDRLDRMIHDLEAALNGTAVSAPPSPPSPQMRAGHTATEEPAPQCNAFSKFLLSVPKSPKAGNGEVVRPRMTVKEVKKGDFRFLRRPNLTVEVTPLDSHQERSQGSIFRVLGPKSTSARCLPTLRRNSLICLTRQTTDSITTATTEQLHGSLTALTTAPHIQAQRDESQRSKRVFCQQKLKQRRSHSNDASFVSMSFLRKSPMSLLRNVLFSTNNNNNKNGTVGATTVNSNEKLAKSTKSATVSQRLI